MPIDPFTGLGKELLSNACRTAMQSPSCRTECNVFVHAVAEKLGVVMRNPKNSNADSIYEEIQRPPWTKIGAGPGASWMAAKRAEDGFFVIAACPHDQILDAKTGTVRGDQHGHVCIVTGVGYVWSGQRSRAAQGMHNHPEKAFFGRNISEAFNHKTLENVYFACQRIPGLGSLGVRPPML